MKFYKGYEKFQKDVEKYINANNIRCKFVGWSGMAGDIDLIKIDGNIKRFDRNTLKLLPDLR
jgi:hypothetical protein